MRILVRAEKENGRIIFKRVLGSVAVMHVPIHDQHALETVTRLKIARGNGHVIQETKSHGSIDFRVMPGRTHRAKHLIHAIVHDRINRGQRPAGGKTGRAPRPG